jgi:hypothetical protein
VALCITDGVMALEPNRYCPALPPNFGPIDIGMQTTISVTVRQLNEILEIIKMTSTVVGVRERLITTLDSLCQMTNDFTESSFTPHHQREQILDFLEECRFELNSLLTAEVSSFVQGDKKQNIHLAIVSIDKKFFDT